MPVFFSDKSNKVIPHQTEIDSITAKVIYKDFQTDLILEESSGKKNCCNFMPNHRH